jgi:hypothetical protein
LSTKDKRWMLEIIGDEMAPAELPRSGMLAIGSSPEKSGLVLSGQGVAEVHCAIGRTKDGSFGIKDLGSEYGTLVNGTKVSQTRLELGDEILLGSVRLRMIASSSAPSKAAPKQAATPKKSAGSLPKSAMPKLDGYQLQRPLGKGAMGDVYLAVQISLDREVALKVLSKKHEEDQAFVASFQAEARSAAALNHPNVVTVHDVGEQDGVHYLTMEYMDRGCLEERVTKEGPLPWTIVLEALKDASSGLVYAESRGIVHRDIKPANLMQNHAGATKIADLGLATSISAEDAIEGDRKIFGTPHFISPEQVRGEKADCRSDLYSLGSTAYRLLTGHTPYAGRNTREILRNKLRGEHTPIHQYSSEVPAGFVAVVERLMALDPADRFPSATGLLRELERLQAGGAGVNGSAASAGTSASTPKLVGALALFAVLATAAYFGLGGEKPQPKPPANNSVQSNEPVGVLDDDPAEDLPTIDDVTEPKSDNDVKEQLFERDAELAFLRLKQRDLAPEEQREALRELARDFFGTTQATWAIEEAEKIDALLTQSVKVETAHNSALEGIFTTLTLKAELTNPALRPGNALRAMKAVEGLEAFADDAVYTTRYAALESEVIAKALEQFAVAMTELTALETAGDFENLKVQMTDLLGRTDLPAFDEGKRPSRVGEVESLADALRGRLDGLENLKSEFHLLRRIEDKRLIGTSIGPGSGFVASLSQLQFSAALAQAQGLQEGLKTEAANAWAGELSSAIESASHALPVLWNDFGDWRRKAVPNPSEDRRGNRDVAKVNSSGLVFEMGGEQQSVPWAEFGAHTSELHMLFSKRLRRDYTSKEAQHIAAFMYLAAVSETLVKASEMLTINGQAVFTSKEAAELPAAFDLALEWCTSAESRANLMQERAASELLGQALTHASDGAWTTSVAELEQLYTDYPQTWVVRLTSDGTSLTLPE